MEGLNKYQIGDSAIVESDELASTGIEVYSGPFNIVSIVASTKKVTLASTTELSTERISISDIVKIIGGAAAGSYTVASILSDTEFTVTEVIADASSGTVSFIYPAGARIIGFDNSTNGFTANKVQPAIEEAKNTAEGKARYCVSCGFDGNASSGRYLEYQSNVVSNIAGFIVPRNSVLHEMSLAVTSSSTTTFSVYRWNGSTETLLTTISLSSARTETVTGLNVSLTAGWEIRVKCTSGSCSRPILFQFCRIA